MNNDRIQQNNTLHTNFNPQPKISTLSLPETFPNMGALCMETEPEKTQSNPVGVNSFCPLPEREMSFDPMLGSQLAFKPETPIIFDHDIFCQRPG